VAPPADDLFSAPAEMKPTAPAPASDDIFGNAPAANPPANAPAPTSSVDDLFGVPPATPPATPAGGSDLDNIFKSTEASPSTDKPFEVSKPVSTDTDSEPNFDELFANPGSSSKVKSTEPNSTINNQAPAVESEEKKLDAGFDNLFKSTSNKIDEPAASPEPAFRGAEDREWVDNTGDYSVKARLVVIYPDRVRLIKENGKFTSVPLSRLSNADRDYVNWVAVSLSKGPAAKFVNTETNPSNNLQELAR
jgi:SLA1 homology domain 1, SHD1